MGEIPTFGGFIPKPKKEVNMSRSPFWEVWDELYFKKRSERSGLPELKEFLRELNHYYLTIEQAKELCRCLLSEYQIVEWAAEILKNYMKSEVF